MKKILTVIILIFCLYQLVLAQSLKRIGTLERKNDSIFVVENGKFYIANKKIVTVKLKSGTYGLDKVVQKIRSNRLGYIDLVVPEGVDLEKYVSVLEKSGKYDLVEYNNIGKYSVITNDTERSNQWYLNNTNAFNAWNLTMGSSNTTVAILDSGVDWRHSDIGNGSDGYKNIDEEAGWNYITNTNNVITVNGHGTRVAGIVAAKSNNFRGMSGMSGGNNSAGITMIPFCVGIDSPDGSVIDDAIIDAVDIGARVIQLSLNVGQTNAINAAIDYAVQNNAVIICASGNNYSSTVSYPASHQDVIAVGATNKSNVRADFSNYGISLDVVAPGVDILSTTLSDGYNSQDGTSFSAPQVSGVAALILSVRPDLTGQQIRNVIEQTAQKVGGYSYVATSGRSNGTWNQEMGYGLVNAYAAVYAVAPRITGSSQICNQATYTINNFPTGASVSWSSSPNNLISHPTSGHPITVTKTGNGQVTLTALINNNVSISKNIWLGAPATPADMTGIYNGQNFGSGGMYSMSITGGDNLQYEWVVYGAQIIEGQGTDRITILTETVYGDTPIYLNVSARVGNACGWGGYINRWGYVQSGAGGIYRISPNPTPESGTVTIEQLSATDNATPEDWTLEVYDTNQTLKQTKKVKGVRIAEINTSGWQKGIYFIRIKTGKKVETQKLVVQ